MAFRLSVDICGISRRHPEHTDDNEINCHNETKNSLRRSYNRDRTCQKEHNNNNNNNNKWDGIRPTSAASAQCQCTTDVIQLQLFIILWFLMHHVAVIITC